MITGENISKHAVKNVLFRLNLTDLDSKVTLKKVKKTSSLTPQERFLIFERVIRGGEAIKKVTEEFGISRKTYYKWLKRFKSDKILSLDIFNDKPWQIKKHPRKITSDLERKILSLVIKNPQLSSHKIAELVPAGNHGVQNVLSRHGLNLYNFRVAYSETNKVYVPRPFYAGAFDRVKSVLEQFVPSLAPAPPPSLRLVKYFVSSTFISFFSSFLILSWLRLLRGPTFSESIGLFFASVALIMGSFFFLYSIKYYLTLALVLSFSQSSGSVGEKEGRIKGLLARIIGGGNGNGNGKGYTHTPAGLEANLEHIVLTRQPFVSIHIPFYNEKNVVERSITAAVNFDYPQYEVILADDSTDETTDIIRNYQNKFLFKGETLKETKGEGWILTEVEVKPGVTLKHLYRTTRSGFKGGALRLALRVTNPKAEFVSVFDADFVPYPDTLTLFLKYFKVQNNMSEDYTKSNVAAVQGYQWHVLNKSENWITRGVRSEYAGSYVIERSGEEIYGGLKQISGSVYMIRKDVLEEIGWETSITEDFELTLKLYEKGYKVVYTPYIQAPAECVSTIKRLVRQRMRWAEGHSHNIRKMWRKLMFNPNLTRSEKLEFLYLSPYYLQAFFFIVGTLSWLISEVVFPARLPFWTSLWGWSLVLTNLISLPLMNGVGMFLEESESKDYLGIASFVALSYLVVPFQAYAAVKGFIEKQEGPWFRTPKTGRITDIFTRGKFFRFISQILPGRANRTATTSYLALDTANNRFEQFAIKTRKGKRWIGKTALSILLIFSTTIVPLSSRVPSIVMPQEVQANSFETLVGPKPESNVEIEKGEERKDREQVFNWGVLAMNTNKFIYQPGEQVKFAIGVLDEQGRTVCDAKLRLEIKNPDFQIQKLTTEEETIKVNPECWVYDVNKRPDFEATYQAGAVGTYDVKLIAISKNGEQVREVTFKVADQTYFVIERNTPTRIYPVKPYTVEIKIKANQDFQGKVEEAVPENFILKLGGNSQTKTFDQVQNVDGEKKLTWNLQFKKDDAVTLAYQYDSPDKSPDYYELGPLKFIDEQRNVVYQETRAWQLAIDATRTWDGGGGADPNWSTPANWSDDTVPVSGDDVVFDNTSTNNSTWDSSGPSTIQSLTHNSTYSGIFTLGRDVTIQGGIWSYATSGGTFSHGNHKITFTGGSSSVTSGSRSYYDIEINKNAASDLTITSDVSVGHNLILTGSSTTQLLGTNLAFAVSGDINVTNLNGGTAIIRINGTGTQTLTGSGVEGQGILPAVTINKSSGTLNLASIITVANAWTYTAGSLSVTGSTVAFYDSNGSGYAINGTHTLNNVTFSNTNTYVTGFTFGTSTTLTVNGTLAIKGSTFIRLGGSSSFIDTKGDITVTNTATIPTGADQGSGGVIIRINGTGNQAFTGSGTDCQGTLPPVTINKASGNLTLSSVISMASTWTFTSMGTGSLITTGSTVAFCDNNGSGVSISGSHTLNNVTFANNKTFVGGFSIGASTTLTVSGTLAVKGTQYFRLGGSTGSYIDAQGDITVTNTATIPAGQTQGSAAVIRINGTGNQTFTGSGTDCGGPLPPVTINKATSGDLTLSSVISVAGVWTYTTVAGSFTSTGSTVAFCDNNGAGYNIAGSHSLNNVTFSNNNTYVAGGFSLSNNNTLTVNGTLSIIGSNYVRVANAGGTGNFAAKGNITVTNTATIPAGQTASSAIVNIDGTTDQVFTGSGIEGQGVLGPVTINKASGDLTLSSVISVGSNWTFTSMGTGSLITTGSTVFFGDTNGGGYNIAGTHSLNNVTFSNVNTYTSGHTITSGTMLTVNGTLAVKGSQYVRIGGSGGISAKGDITVTNTATIPAGQTASVITITINGTTDQTLTGSGTEGQGVLGPVTINKASGNLTLSSVITVGGSPWTFTSVGSGTLITTGSTVAFYDGGYSSKTISGTHTLNNVTFYNNYGSSVPFTVSNTLTISGTMAIKGAYALRLGTGTINAQGDITITNTGSDTTNGGGGASLNINGTESQTLTGSGTAAQGILPNTTVNKSNGSTLNLASIISLGGSWTWTAGTLSAGTSTMVLYGLNGTTLNPSSVTYNNFTLANTGATTYTLSSALTISGTLTKEGNISSIFGTSGTNYAVTAGNIFITAGTFNANGSTITVSGNFTNSATFTKNTSTIVFNGAGSSTVEPGSSDFNNFTVSTASKSMLFGITNTTTITGTLTLNGGACSTLVSLNSTDGSSQFTINATGTKSVSYVRVANSNATTAITATNTLNDGNNTNWTITTDSCPGSTSSSATGYSFQRKTWYDGTQLWRAFHDGTQIVFYYSTDWGTNWTQNSSATLAISTNDFSIEADSSNAFIFYYNPSTYSIHARTASSYPGTAFSWGSATSVFGGSVGAPCTYPAIIRDSSGYFFATGVCLSGSTYYFNVKKSTNVNDTSAWLGSTVLDSSANSNKYGTIVSLGSGNMYAVWIDNTTIEGKKYNGTSWDGSPTSIATSGTGLNNNMSMVADSSGYAHLLYIDSNDYAVYQEYTTSWQTAVNLDTNAGNDYATISIDTANNDLYALWIRSNTIYYKKGVSPYASGNWDTSATSFYSTGTNTYVTSNYSGDGMIFAEWTTGTGSPYTVNWKYAIIPEKIWMLLGLGLVVPGFIKRWKRRKVY
ncbi:hypothetical protein A2961_05240 [Candidatus Woesebacteria bacterium RIFCSPLOWO2_01_FULL_39_21]|uniref:Glycosyltransferase 2-like domain-containing protein n=1 Tax=Candidatus Woesebacteria bacterium RIFCSPLOWO2_01_FULL_39_21 TaxID=1802519 RepID=A0A1F8BGS6_9BACT|nr:MAG: hypothetical protein A2961_05240 [Candidatus Woesebacteria bacterium RIFCSPLOWO2_01_FULL_39_21]